MFIIILKIDFEFWMELEYCIYEFIGYLNGVLIDNLIKYGVERLWILLMLR